MKFLHTCIGVLVILYFSLFVFLSPIMAISSTDQNLIFAQYHLWYSKEDVFPTAPNQPWAHWSQKTWEITNGVDPINFLSPWRRVTFSRLGLPLTGIYSSQRDLEAVKYNFQQAKIAGIDGLFGSVYDGGWKPIFRTHLDVAQQANIPLGMELYGGVDVDRVSLPSPFNSQPMQNNGCTISRKLQSKLMSDMLRDYKSHPNYLRIDGKPVIWIANGIHNDYAYIWSSYWPNSDCTPRPFYNWGGANEMALVLSEAESAVGEPIYVIATTGTVDNQNRPYSPIPQIGKIVTGENIALFWNLFGHDVQITPQLTQTHSTQYLQSYQGTFTHAKNQAGNKFSAHIYPAFDERGLFPGSLDRGSGITVPRTVITRDGNGMFAKNDGFLDASLDLAKTNNVWVFLESLNDWGEQHAIEPGFTGNNFSSHQDFFSALRRVAEFKGISSPQFTFPDPSIIDSPLVTYCRNKQFTGAKVRLKGKFGLNKPATSSNGVLFSITRLEDDVSYQSPSYRNPTHWESIYSVVKPYNGQLQSFDVDLTPFLDKPEIIFDIWSNGDTNSDQVYFPQLILDWYGQQIDLLNSTSLARLKWYSREKVLTFPHYGTDGSTALETNVTLEDNQTYPKALYVHPDYNSPGDRFITAAFKAFGAIEPDIQKCSPTPAPSATSTQPPSTSTPSHTPPPTTKKGDFNNDGSVNLADLSVLFSSFGQTNAGNPTDISGDGKVDIFDFSILVTNYGR